MKIKKFYTSLLLLFFITYSFAQVEGTWKIAPIAQALASGAFQGDFSWWSNSEADVTTRACFFDDEYVFNPDGTFKNVQGDETWNEPWQGMNPEGCGAPVAPHNGSASATWNYNGGILQINGVGAYLGLAKVHNGGELLSSPGDAPSFISYPVAIDGDTMTINLSAGGGYWHFVLWKDPIVSVVEIVEDMFSFYPNPASTEVQIKSDQQLDEIIIRDITGKSLIVRSNPSLSETIDVSALPRGFYILESLAGELKSVQKLALNY